MRTFLNGAGVDVTNTVFAYLKAHRTLIPADLVLIGELEDPLALWLTNYEAPLTWPLYGTFNPAGGFTRDKITSQVGLKVEALNFSWAPRVFPLGINIATANVYQKAQTGFYDNKKFRLWRTFMPTPGDANTFGACEMFGGRVSQIVVERARISFTINSFLDVTDQLLPPNVIESQNTRAGYSGAVPVLSDGETQVPEFTVVSPSSADNILARCTSPTLNKVYGTNKFQFGWIQFNPGSTLAGYYSQVAQSGNFKSAGVHYNQFIPYQAFPWPPVPGDTFFASIKPPVNKADTTPLFGFRGFKYVPQPEGAA